MEKILVYGMTNKIGGIESYIMNLYRNIDNDKLTFDFVSDFDSIVFEKEIKDTGSMVHYIPSKSSDLKGHILKFREILKNHPEYRIVYFNVLNAGSAITATVAKLMRRKVVIHSHSSSDAQMGMHRILRPLLKILSDSRLACSNVAAEYMFGKVKNVHVINNCIPTEKYVFSPEVRKIKQRELGVTDENFVILHAGRMTQEKNPLFLIKVFKEILIKEPSAILLYAGTGEMESEIKTLASTLKLDQSVKFLGMRNDMAELYQAGDIFLLPSKYEGLPVSLIEAQAAGLRSYTSDGVSEEAAITPLLSHISLAKNAEEWADIIVKNGKTERKNMEKEIEEAGYSITCEVAKTQNLLLATVRN